MSQGMQVGVLLVRLCSAALQTGGELTHPAVRLTIGKQVLQPIHTCPRALVNTWPLPSRPLLCLGCATSCRLDT
jgi:hypothetical protein